MGPCTKGVDAQWIEEATFQLHARQGRAFALKPSFTRDVFQQKLPATVK